jgi:hypothetical protein
MSKVEQCHPLPYLFCHGPSLLISVAGLAADGQVHHAGSLTEVDTTSPRRIGNTVFRIIQEDGYPCTWFRDAICRQSRPESSNSQFPSFVLSTDLHRPMCPSFPHSANEAPAKNICSR